MSLVTLCGGRSKIASFLEMILFCGICYLFLLGVTFLYAAIAGQARAVVPWYSPVGWAAVLPAWMYAVQAVGLLGLITIYWSPGDEQQNRNEVLAFAIFLLLAAALAGWGISRWWTRHAAQAPTSTRSSALGPSRPASALLARAWPRAARPPAPPPPRPGPRRSRRR